MRWYKRDTDVALSSMAELSLSERGVYNTIIDLFYSRDGDLPDDERLVCRHLYCRPQTWRRFRASLSEKEKIWIEDGKIWVAGGKIRAVTPGRNRA